jgi:hypothetical protein
MNMNKHRSDFLPHLPKKFIASLILSLVALPNIAGAQNWRLEPIMRVGGEYDDNATLDVRTDSEIKLEGFLADLRADISYSSETTTFFLQPRVLVRNYPDEPAFDSDDYFLRTRYRYSGQSNTLEFRANFDQQQVRTGERAISDVENDDPIDITDDDTSLLILSGSRDKWRVSPSWERRMSNISSIGLDLDYFDVRYEKSSSLNLADYTDARVNANYRREFSSVNAGLLTLTARRFDTEIATSDVTGYGLMVGFDRTLSEKMNLTAMIGAEDTQQTAFESDPELVGFVTLTRNLKTIRMFAQYRRSVNAGGAARLTLRDSLSFNFRRRLSEKISAGLGIRAYQSRGVGDATSLNDRDYIQLQSTFLWYLSQSFFIETSYRYTIVDRSDAIGERSNSNQANVWFVYQPRTIPKL